MAEVPAGVAAEADTEVEEEGGLVGKTWPVPKSVEVLQLVFELILQPNGLSGADPTYLWLAARLEMGILLLAAASTSRQSRRTDWSAAKTYAVFAAWDGADRGPLGDWRQGRNDLEAPAKALVPQIETVLAWLSVQPGAEVARMSGSGATCFALFESEAARDFAADNVPREWWRLATFLR